MTEEEMAEAARRMAIETMHKIHKDILSMESPTQRNYWMGVWLDILTHGKKPVYFGNEEWDIYDKSDTAL